MRQDEQAADLENNATSTGGHGRGQDHALSGQGDRMATITASEEGKEAQRLEGNVLQQ